jgi:hypothetical protein
MRAGMEVIAYVPEVAMRVFLVPKHRFHPMFDLLENRRHR